MSERSSAETDAELRTGYEYGTIKQESHKKIIMEMKDGTMIMI
jgi:hypothetical protein